MRSRLWHRIAVTFSHQRTILEKRRFLEFLKSSDWNSYRKNIYSFEKRKIWTFERCSFFSKKNSFYRVWKIVFRVWICGYFERSFIYKSQMLHNHSTYGSDFFCKGKPVQCTFDKSVDCQKIRIAIVQNRKKGAKLRFFPYFLSQRQKYSIDFFRWLGLDDKNKNTCSLKKMLKIG